MGNNLLPTFTFINVRVKKRSTILIVSIILIIQLDNFNQVLCDTDVGVGANIDADLIKVQNSDFNATSKSHVTLKNTRNVEKLKLIRKLSHFEPNSGQLLNETYDSELSQNQVDICYTEECLDAALGLLNSIDFDIDPCDNFYKFSCGRWIHNNPVPPSSPRWNTMEVIRDKAKLVTRGILVSPIEESDLNSVKQAKEFYSLCIDDTNIEKRGVAPLLQILEPYGGWPAITPDWNPPNFDVNKAIADGFRLFLQEIILTIDLLKSVDNTEYHLVVNKPGEFFLPLPVLRNPEKHEPQINAYKTYFISVAKELAKATGSKASVTDAELRAQVEDVIKFETRLVLSNENETYDDIQDQDQNQAQEKSEEVQPRSRTELNLTTLLNHLFSTSGISIDLEMDKNLISIDQNYISNLTTILRSTDIRTVANYFTWRLVSTFSLLTTNTSRDLELDFDKVNLGLVESEPRETTCSSLALSVFGMAITYKYVEETFDGDAKGKVKEMVNEIQESFMQSLNESSWMDEETKSEANKKMNAMKKFIAYPDWLFNQSILQQRYEGLTIFPNESFRTIMGYLYWDANKTLNLFRTIPDIHVNTWVFAPSTLSVFYRPPYNSLTIPSRILQPPIYRNKGLQALNYGGIGTIIAHEITHGFDFKGRQFNSEGTKKNWWTEKTLKRFIRRASCFTEQYNDLKTEVGRVDGHLTRYENIGDNVGIRQSFLAYQNWVKDNNGRKEEPRLPGLESFTPQQLFFLSYAQSLCESVTEKSLYNQLLESTYSPARFRAQVPLQNFQQFAQDWNCPAGSPMNPPPGNRCFLL